MELIKGKIIIITRNICTFESVYKLYEFNKKMF